MSNVTIVHTTHYIHQLYTSNGRNLEIKILPRNPSFPQGEFLLKYEGKCVCNKFLCKK